MAGEQPEPAGNRPGIRAGNSPEMVKNARVISYNLREGERPGGMKVRFKVRIETGKKAAALDARQAEAIRELLSWARQHQTPTPRTS
jgi:hypothetical protein